MSGTKSQSFFSFGFLFLLFFCFSNYSSAQKETNHWYFGFHCGLDFNSNPPAVLNNGMTCKWEGTSAISDNNGNLLFYATADTIWNKLHQVMANGAGLLGSINTTQCALIARRPGSTVIFDVFSLEGTNNPTGLYHSVVDMSLASGNGSVTVKNAPVYVGPLGERLAATRHCNGNDVWVICHESQSSVFRAYLLSASGLASSPVTSTVGTFHHAASYQGHIKFSQRGNRLAVTAPASNQPPDYYGFAEILDFDNSTGLVSNPLFLGVFAGITGCEFSPDGSKFYAGYGPTAVVGQWDLCAGTNTAIAASLYTLAPLQNYVSGLQLAANGKIYIASNLSHSLSVINNPDLPGAACSFTSLQSVQPNSAGGCLPNFVSGFYKSPPSPFLHAKSELSCQTVSFSPAPTYSCQSVINPGLSCAWNFGDPGSAAANTSTLTDPVHTFSSPGTYTVIFTLLYPCSTETISQVINVQAAPALNINNSSSQVFLVCKNSSVSFTSTGADTYSWSTGAAGSIVSFTPSVTQTVSVTGTNTLSGCKTVKTLTLDVRICPGFQEHANSVINYYPNPVSSFFQLEVYQAGEIELYDLNGELLFVRPIIKGANYIDMRDVTEGVYVMNVKQDKLLPYRIKLVKSGD